MIQEKGDGKKPRTPWPRSSPQIFDRCKLNLLPTAGIRASDRGRMLFTQTIGTARPGEVFQLVKTGSQTGETEGEQKARKEPGERGG